ncbi:MAG: carbohydrate kinase family protein [Chloroflexi bacterium]|nr:carbohydrate kinase family protein [Chloroflexota bacterium]
MTTTFDIIGLGAMNLDQLYMVERLLVDGEARVEKAVRSAGGSAANTCYGLAKLGLKVGFAGAVGDDETGQMLVRSLAEAGVDTSHIRVKAGTTTGTALCLSDRRQRRSIYVSPGANSLLSPADLDWSYLEKASLVHTSSFADDAQLALQIDMAQRLPAATGISFAPGAIYARKGLAALAPLLRRTRVLFLNHKELEMLTGDDLAGGTRALLGSGCRLVVVTLGSQRQQDLPRDAVCYIDDGEQGLVVTAPRKKMAVVDTTGAGDAFASGFLYGIATGKGLYQCGLLGHLMAGFCITQVGARAGLPTLEMLQQSYQEY